MIVQSLAVKYRPKSILELVGQDSVAAQIKGMVKAGHMPSALLLNGNSGCGKTTTSRLIARMVNCTKLDPKTLEPCGVCPSCKLGHDSPDYNEVNVGDTRGIDDIRALAKSANAMPMVGRNRIIVLDECFPGDTDVVVAPGTFVRLDSINAGDSILSYDTSTEELRLDTVTATENKEVQSLLRVWLSDGSFQECTSNHKWWSVTRNKMVRADELVAEEELLPLGIIKDRLIKVLRIYPIFLPSLVKVYDIGVKQNHNFFIRPKGSKDSVLVSNCHALLGPASNALLKGLEDTPKRTLWILATTNPEKLLPTIVGRCTKLNLTAIDPDSMSKRLRFISKEEGVDLKKLEGGDAIIKTIVSLSNGQMRDAVSLLESALFSMKGSKKITAADVLKNFTQTGEADLERMAADLLVAILKKDIKTIVKVSRQSQGSCRAILSKLRWLVQYNLDNAVGLAKYKPYSAKLFSEAMSKSDTKCGLRILIGVQSLLVDIEERLNRMSVDESVVLLSMLSNFSITWE